jgi:hypothetical protein
MPKSSAHHPQAGGSWQKTADAFLHVPIPPEELPPIEVADLIDAWQAATQAATMALDASPGDYSPTPQGIIFERPDGEETAIHFADRDAACWALAVDRSVGLDDLHGLAVCFRLLGLIDQLAHAVWLRPHFSVGGKDGPEIHPAILKTAAQIGLTREARFDAAQFQKQTQALLGSARLS